MINRYGHTTSRFRMYGSIHYALMLLLPATSCLAAGDGTSGNPYTDDEVTRAVLNLGGTAESPNCSSLRNSPAAYLNFDANDYAICVGSTTSYNYLYASGGASFGDVLVQIGVEAGSNHNLVEIKDYAIDSDSGMTLSVGDKGLYVGNKGSYNTLRILSDADAAVGENSVWIGYASSGNSILVDGSGSTLDASQYEGSSIFVGLDGSDNSLKVSNSGKVWSYDMTLGGYTPSGGQHNSITVTGYDSLVEVTHYFVIGAGVGNGAPGTNNTLTIADGGSFLVDGGDCTLGGGEKANNSVSVSGTNAWFAVQGAITFEGRGDSIFVNNAGRVTCGSLKINNFSDKIWLSGSGSSFFSADDVTILDDGVVTIDDGAVFKVGDSTSDELILADSYHQTSARYIRMSGGYLAWYGDRKDAIKALADAGNLLIRNSTTLMWDKASYDDLSVTYYTTAQESDAKTATGISGLGGYTVVLGGHKLTPNQTWYKCSWYGGYYSNTDAIDVGGWIYHFDHGYQYVYADSAYDSAYMWDFGLGFVTTSPLLYPYFYSYTYERWFYYKDGSYPNRRVWDYKAGGWVYEQDIVP